METPSYLALTLQHFQCFLMVAEQGTMVKAAELLNISQPLMSQKIAQLEAELHVKLFSRNKRKLQLTEAGQRFQAECGRIMEELNALVSDLSGQYGPVRKQSLTIGFSDGQEPSSTKKMVSLFRRELPGVPIEVQIESRMLLVERLLSDELDVCIIVDTEGLILNRGIGYRKVATLPQSVMVHTTSKLAQLEHVTWGDLDGHKCFWPESLRNTKYTRDIHKFFREQGIAVQFEYHNVDYYTLRRYLYENEHFTLTLSSSVDDPTLKLLLPGGLSYPMVLAWKRSNTARLEPYVDRLAGILKANLPK